MNFTSKIKLGLVGGGILIAASMSLIGWGNYAGSTPTVAKENTPAIQGSYRATDLVWFIPPSESMSTPGFPRASSDYYQPVTAWYKSKHWWKRNAPIVGGAGGGALVGGLVGGGPGALVGGAVGGGGGYLYKRSRSHHHHYHH